MSRTPSLAVRLKPDAKEALIRAAKAEDRSLSFMAAKIITEWLTATHLLLPKRKDKA